MLTEGILYASQCRDFAERIRHVELKPVTADDPLMEGANMNGPGNTPEKWTIYFAGKRDRLVRFLKLGSETDGIECSL